MLGLGRLRDRLSDTFSALRAPLAGSGLGRLRAVLLRLLCIWSSILMVPSVGLVVFAVWILIAFAPGSGFFAALATAIVMAVVLVALGLAFGGAALWGVTLAVDRDHGRTGARTGPFILGLVWALAGGLATWMFVDSLDNPDGPFWGIAAMALIGPGGLLGIGVAAVSVPVSERLV